MQFLQIKTYASVCLMSLGVLGLLSTVCAYTSCIPAGDVSYQWLWCGWVSIIFLILILLAVSLSSKVMCHFYHSVTWGFILMGGIEAFLGLRQIYGFAISHHSLYAVTGSFYNPGPYSGYLAFVFPICLYEYLRLNAIKQRTWIVSIEYYFSIVVLLLLICVLPAGMSRSAWIATVASGIFVCSAHSACRDWLRRLWEESRRMVLVALTLLSVILILGSIGIYHMKADSARGRLFMWKISCLAIAEKPISGYGIGNFVYAYGHAQEAYFAKGEYDEDEERVAGSPEFAFNEYLRIVVECGIPVLMFVIAIVGVSLYQGVKLKRFGICGGLISLLFFSFSSYPMTYPCFLLAFLLLIVCCFEYSRNFILLLALIVGSVGVGLVKYNKYDACRKWSQCKMLYKIKAYSKVKEEYGKLYPLLKDRSRFLFEYGRCLHNLKDYEASNKILKEAEFINCDPMILNLIGKNFQALKKYREAEHWLLRSTRRLPGRIYPYYLLAKLYAEPDYWNPIKLKHMVNIVLTKEPKVQSSAIREMRDEVEKLIGL